MAPLGSRLESQLVLRNDAGQVIAESSPYENRADAVLTCKLPAAGKYTSPLLTAKKAGARIITIASTPVPQPYITRVFPLGVRAGEPAAFP